jgi:hypothetical protein
MEDTLSIVVDSTITFVGGVSINVTRIRITRPSVATYLPMLAESE